MNGLYDMVLRVGGSAKALLSLLGRWLSLCSVELLFNRSMFEAMACLLSAKLPILTEAPEIVSKERGSHASVRALSTTDTFKGRLDEPMIEGAAEMTEQLLDQCLKCEVSLDCESTSVCTRSLWVSYCPGVLIGYLPHLQKLPSGVRVSCNWVKNPNGTKQECALC